jgi:hypothetical protein
MKGDIAFAGFVLTPDEWHLLDDEVRAELIAITTRQADPWLPTSSSEPLAEGSGPFESIADVVERDPASASELEA